jgi:hypothetical protein
MVSTKYPDTGPGRGGPGVSAILVACPECELPAEITERFWLDSTDGPVLHVSVSCVDGHHFRMPADRLPADVQPAFADAVPPDTGDQSAPAPQVGFVRLPGRLGIVASAVSAPARAEGATSSLA